MLRNPLLRTEALGVAAKVLPGHAVEACDDLAPAIRELFTEGQVIPNLDAFQALELSIAGVVEMMP